MSKKTKKQVRKTSAATLPNVQPASDVAVSAAPISPMRMTEREFNPDYSPVIKDLKRIGILAGAFISILVILSFFLR